MLLVGICVWVSVCDFFFSIVRDDLRIEKWMGPFNGRSVVIVSR